MAQNNVASYYYYYYYAKEETVREWDRDEAKVAAKISQLQSERNDLAQRLAKMEVSFVNQKEGWDRERNKTLALKYSKHCTVTFIIHSI